MRTAQAWIRACHSSTVIKPCLVWVAISISPLMCGTIFSISRAIVNAHGGQLRAASEGTGRGANFTVELKTAVPVIRERPEDAGVSLRGQPAQKCRLLFVEDHKETLAVITSLLERDGHRIFAATGVREALERAEEHECDMVISDIGLPDGTGFMLMAEIKRRYGWPGIAISGFGMNADIKHSKAAGFVKHLVKPVGIATLRQAIQEVAASNNAPAPAAAV